MVTETETETSAQDTGLPPGELEVGPLQQMADEDRAARDTGLPLGFRCQHRRVRRRWADDFWIARCWRCSCEVVVNMYGMGHCGCCDARLPHSPMIDGDAVRRDSARRIQPHFDEIAERQSNSGPSRFLNQAGGGDWAAAENGMGC